MKIGPKLVLAASFLLFGVSCNSDEECTKMMLIPHGYFVGYQFYTYDVLEEVSCDFPEPGEITETEPVLLDNFTYEVIHFEFIGDTGNNTSRLHFEIVLNNPNSKAATGVPIVTISSGGLQFETDYTAEAQQSCTNIAANSSCTFLFTKEYPLDPDIGAPTTFELLKVAYYLTN